MKNKLHYLLLVVAAISFSSCDDDEKQETVPQVTTGAVTDVTQTTATVAGEITDDGGPVVTVSGIVYSSTNGVPTLADSFTEEATTDGEFSSDLTGLTSSTTYYVRAYAINKKGTGYGDVVEFTTGNAAPTATNVSVTGTAEVNKMLTATYTYADAENNTEGGSTFKWYVANDAQGTGEAAIAGATALTYTIQVAEQGKYIRFGVTPNASAGTTTGEEVKSAFVGAVGEATTVTFNYNGQQVTYGILNSAATGRKWMDRNLGAPNAPTSATDFANYGDLFQWGRSADGHQLITRTGPADADISGVSTTTVLATTDNPGHSNFILNDNTVVGGGNWRTYVSPEAPENTSLWQGASGTNNPCPTGWRIATAEEWTAENLGTLTEAFGKLKITLTGSRAGTSGNFSGSATSGRYWTSTLDITSNPNQVVRSTVTTEATALTAFARSSAYACRCIKD